MSINTYMDETEVRRRTSMVGHEYLIRTIYLFSCSVDESKTGSLEGSAFVLSLRQETFQDLATFSDGEVCMT